eukprot:CAMPEP_0116872190 /NCGR_PEP_ID=MMETSP0463-20121206/2882_1 /TAXON_ID=181622 /ORGANISM="Strombidinopsis sp, Strain SopsisLIS2011" /LENGTH=67 /DNA_ID=CAMNT_0004512047 /DNA_START=913 /DNA_END=1116 /DNA_ORIENTATION=+
MIYHLEMNQQYKKRLLDIIHSKCDKMKDMQRELTQDVVQGFDFITACFNETMRLEPPAFVSTPSCFS